MKLLQELIELQENVLSMKDHLEKKAKKEDDEVNDMLDRANKMTDMGMPRSAKITTDLAKKKHDQHKAERKRFPNFYKKTND